MRETTREITYRDALKEALIEEMERDERTAGLTKANYRVTVNGERFIL